MESFNSHTIHPPGANDPGDNQNTLSKPIFEGEIRLTSLLMCYGSELKFFQKVNRLLPDGTNSSPLK